MVQRPRRPNPFKWMMGRPTVTHSARPTWTHRAWQAPQTTGTGKRWYKVIGRLQNAVIGYIYSNASWPMRSNHGDFLVSVQGSMYRITEAIGYVTHTNTMKASTMLRKLTHITPTLSDPYKSQRRLTSYVNLPSLVNIELSFYGFNIVGEFRLHSSLSRHRQSQLLSKHTIQYNTSHSYFPIDIPTQITSLLFVEVPADKNLSLTSPIRSYGSITRDLPSRHGKQSRNERWGQILSLGA